MATAFRPPSGHVFRVDRARGYVLAKSGHGADWRAVFGQIDPDALWSIVAGIVTSAPVDEYTTWEPWA